MNDDTIKRDDKRPDAGANLDQTPDVQTPEEVHAVAPAGLAPDDAIAVGALVQIKSVPKIGRVTSVEEDGYKVRLSADQFDTTAPEIKVASDDLFVHAGAAGVQARIGDAKV